MRGHCIAYFLFASSLLGSAQTGSAPAKKATKQERRIAKQKALQEAKKSCTATWIEGKGCFVIIDDRGNEIRVDTQSSSVGHRITNEEFEQLPAERSLTDIINLP